MIIKKQFEEIFALLEAHPTKQVKTLMPQLLEMMQAKKGGSELGTTFLKNEGSTYAVYCYYHKKWELVETEEASGITYGKKANTATGLNTMCKEGVSMWGKQQRNYKKSKDALLMQIMSQELSSEELPAELEKLDEAKNVIVEHTLQDTYSYSNAEECTNAFNEEL